MSQLYSFKYDEIIGHHGVSVQWDDPYLDVSRFHKLFIHNSRAIVQSFNHKVSSKYFTNIIRAL